MVKVSKIDLKKEKLLSEMYESIVYVDKTGKPIPMTLTKDTSPDPENDRGEE